MKTKINVKYNNGLMRENAARMYKMNLCASQIEYSDILLLAWAVQKAFEDFNRLHENDKNKTVSILELYPRIYYRQINAHTGMLDAKIDLLMDGQRRPMINFFKSGAIAIAEWADDIHIKPILQAFKNWVTVVTIDKIRDAQRAGRNNTDVNV